MKSQRIVSGNLGKKRNGDSVRCACAGSHVMIRSDGARYNGGGRGYHKHFFPRPPGLRVGRDSRGTQCICIYPVANKEFTTPLTWGWIDNSMVSILL